MTTKSQKIEGRILSIPRVVLAGTHSGVGKTSLSLALVSALRRRGLRVQTFKVGPDFLDPTYLALASGRPCYNLDGWMTGSKDYVCRLFGRVSEDADIAVMEGVMGLFDGADPATIEGSTGEVAKWLHAPVLLIANAHGLGRSLAAMVKGYASFEPGVNIAGVIANQCGSEEHSEGLAHSLQASSLPPLLGAIPRGRLAQLPSRHLGLVTADANNLAPSTLDALAQALEQHASLEGILRVARSAPPLEISAPERKAVAKRWRVAVARDRAFHFYYQDLFDELEMGGCELIPFSPAEDQRLPACEALYIGGGYPEEHAAALSANKPMLEAIRQLAAANRPIYAECGGLMYLAKSLETGDGREYPMVGLLPAATRMLDHKKVLGYVEVTLKEDSLWGAKGTKFRGHEFHYSEMSTDPTGRAGWQASYTLRRRRAEGMREEGFQCGRVLASYVHLHLASHPEALRFFIYHCGENS
jgi:cobyrinic acid a,c-diamide synthase